MKIFYHKLLLLLAFLALLGGVAFYMLQIEPAPGRGSIPDIQPAGNPYEPVPIPNPTVEDTSWPEPGPQSSGPNWVYDVFTPPKIYIDAEGNFTAEPPKPPEPPKPFGLYLAEMERKPYRIQMQGFSGDRDKPEEAVLFFFDEEREVKFFIREGQRNEESGVEVLDFTIEVEIDPEKGEAKVTAIAKILDRRTGEEITLNDEERLFSPEISLIFLSEEDPGIRVELSLKPEDLPISFGTTLGQYELQEINLEDRTVTVEKQSTDESEAKSRTLIPEAFNQPAPEEEEEEPIEESEETSDVEGGGVDSFFE